MRSPRIVGSEGRSRVEGSLPVVRGPSAASTGEGKGAAEVKTTHAKVAMRDKVLNEGIFRGRRVQSVTIVKWDKKSRTEGVCFLY